MYRLSDLFLSLGVTNSPGWFSDITLAFWPMPHQMEALRDYLTHSRFMDASDPGTGKTYPAQAYAVFMAALGNKVCFSMPPKLIDQFEEELTGFFRGIENRLSIGSYTGTARRKEIKLEQWDTEGWPDILMMSYDGYRTLNSSAKMKTVPRGSWRLENGESYWSKPGVAKDARAPAFTKDGRQVNRRGKAKNLWQLGLVERGYNVHFFDEGHALCGVASQISDAVKQTSNQLKDDVAISVMTGTPVPTHLEDSYGIIRIINPDAYPNYLAFERMHCITGNVTVRGKEGKEIKVKKITGYKNVEMIHEALFKNARRVQKRDVITLPEPLIGMIKVRLSPPHLKLYRSVVNEFFAVTSEGIVAPDSQSEMRAIALRLISCPDEFEPKLSKDNEVAKAADAYLDSVNPANHKVIIFAYHKSVIKFLGERYKEWNPALVFGESTGSSGVKKFKTDDTCRIAIINWVAGGAGLNLQISSHLLFYECPTSPKDAKQAIARADRNGQQNIVNVTFLRVLQTISDKNFRNLLKNEEINNQVVKDEKDLLYEVLKAG